MQAIILAAGISTRTYPLTVNKPKPLLPIMDKTLLEHNLEQLNGLVDEAIIVVGYKAEAVKKLFNSRYKKIRLRYVTQKQQLGTGHAVLQAEKYIKDRFIIIPSDDLNSRKDLKTCLRHKYCVQARIVKYPKRFGILEVKDNKVIGIEEKPEKPKTNIANTATWVMDKKLFDIIKKLKKSKRGEYEITDVNLSYLKNASIPLMMLPTHFS